MTGVQTCALPIWVDQSGVEKDIRALLPGYMAMGKEGLSEHSGHLAMGMLPGPENTLPMMTGQGPFGAIEMGGMFTVVKVRDDLAAGDYRDPGWYSNPQGTVAQRVSTDPNFGNPIRKAPTATSGIPKHTHDDRSAMPGMQDRS